MRGHIQRRGKSWRIKITQGRDPATGKVRQKWFTFPTRQEAETQLADMLAKIHGGGSVPITKQTVAEFLDAWLKKRAGAVRETSHESYRQIVRRHLTPDLGLVFCQPDGKPLHLHNIVCRDFRQVTKKAKLPRIRFHDLRHSHATDLLAHGEHPKVVSERLGHYDPAFTLRVYSHVLPGMQAQAAARLEERLFGDRAKSD